MQPLPPLPPPLPRRFALIGRLRALPRWGLAVSLAIHAVLATVVGSYHPFGGDVAAEDVVFSNIVVVTPPPPSPPRPTPTPIVRPLPAPRERIPAGGTPRTARVRMPAPLRLNVFHASAKSTGQSVEQGYVAPRGGNANGVPGGTGTGTSGLVGAGGTDAAGVVGAPTPLLTATPRPPAPSPTPTCAVAHAAARTLRAAEPVYPAQLANSGVTGTVLVLISLSASGEVLAASVYRSSHNPLLDRAAIAAARASTYAPESVDCVPVSGTYLFQVDFYSVP